MHCFSHRDAQAIGICRICGKGVCPACAREVENGIVCSEACATQAGHIHQMNQRALKIYGIGAPQKGLPNSVIAPLLMGTGFAFAAVLMWYMMPGDLTLVLFLLLIMSFTWLGAFLAWRKFRENGLNV